MKFSLKWQSFPSPDGPLAFANIPWDSALYEFPFYDLKLGDAAPAQIEPPLADWLKQLPADKSCLVVASINPGAVSLARILIRHDFYPIETLIELHMSLARFHPVITSHFQKMLFRPAQAGDLPRMMAIARAAFSTDRFHLDPNLPAHKSDERYARWVESSFTNGDMLYALEDTPGGRIVGIAAAKEETKTIYHLTFVAMDKAHHNKGAGVFLIQSIVGVGKTRGYKICITHASANNINSLKSAEKTGFRIHNAAAKFHWFRRGLV